VQQPLAIGQLGEAMGISRQAARQMADGLVERGYATFGTDDAGARRTLVVLTLMGKAYGRAIWMAQDALNERVRSRVSEADLAAADAVLRAVFPDDDARQRVDKRMPPLSERPLSGRRGLRIVARRQCSATSISGAENQPHDDLPVLGHRRPGLGRGCCLPERGSVPADGPHAAGEAALASELDHRLEVNLRVFSHLQMALGHLILPGARIFAIIRERAAHPAPLGRRLRGSGPAACPSASRQTRQPHQHHPISTKRD
jgi:DNA-binding MarR family transcriptional regulator